LTEQTRYMIDEAAIAKLPRGGYLINTARGAVVKTDAVPPALASGQLAGAGIDVLEAEPPTDDDPLITAWRDPKHPAHDRLIINSHAAFYCEEGLIELREKAARACLDVLTGQTLRNQVN